MESGCHYILNWYCHADGRNKHSIRHSFVCLTFKRSAECHTMLASIVPAWGAGATEHLCQCPFRLALCWGKEGSSLQHIRSPFTGSKPASMPHDLKVLLPPPPHTHTAKWFHPTSPGNLGCASFTVLNILKLGCAHYTRFHLPPVPQVAALLGSTASLLSH